MSWRTFCGPCGSSLFFCVILCIEVLFLDPSFIFMPQSDGVGRHTC